jgi:hypothetical protein
MEWQAPGDRGRRDTVPVQSNPPDRSQMFELVLARVQHQPVELKRESVGCDRRGQWPLPGIVGCRFEALEQLEARFAKAMDDGLG